ncbi:tricarboxylate transporter [Paracoccus aestuarii]|uniref:Tricarboxylate transporter n=1 Tax=Paracoccus aestuarii TaxID=453842 RepID=A0A418ZZM5_9RHOB|nr:tripartite tricarboxylate transporter substrate-binding protein [Paracoccus aestuarii]RJL05957.1 tricarboxylate transporter [Paracoccus aestuarii]WCQ98427.1 tricarboxylate transporter [Paracoccus aestuarii]
MQDPSPARRIVGAVLSLVIAALPAGAQDLGAQDFPSGPLRMVIPFSEGGGSDVWARFHAPILSRHLPGQPPITVQNEPGGGGTRGSNAFATQAAPDGTTLLGTSGSSLFAWLLGDFRVRYDFADWTVLMASPTGGVVYVSDELGLSSWRDIDRLQDQRLVFASQGITSLDLVPMLAFRLLGFDAHYVFGYTGRGDGLEAMRHREVNIDYQTTSAYLRNVAPMVAAGEAVPLMTWGVVDAQGQVRRDPTFPDLPTLEELYEFRHGHPPSGPEYDAYRVFASAGFAAQKMLVLLGDTPAPIRDTWLEAIRAARTDPEYLDRAPEVLGAYQTLVGEEAEALARSVIRIDPGTRAFVLDLLASEYSVRLTE